MKFYIYNLLKGQKIIKHLITWNELVLFANDLFQEEAKKYNKLAFESKDMKTEKKFLDIEWSYKCACSSEFYTINALKSLGYEVIQREIKLDLLPKLSTTDNYFKFNNVPKKLISHKDTKLNNSYLSNKKGKDRKLRPNHSPHQIKSFNLEKNIDLLK